MKRKLPGTLASVPLNAKPAEDMRKLTIGKKCKCLQ